MRDFVNMDIDIHTVKTCYQRWYHQRNRQACHAFHDGIHIVGNNGSKSVHCTCKNITVDVDCIKCLF